MLATLRHEAFSDPAWIYERKLDGIRCLAYRDGGAVELHSRNRLRLDGRFAELARALERQRLERFVIDGEIVALERGATSFGGLQRGGAAVHLYVFDALVLGERDLRELPVLERKRLLRAAFDFSGRIHFTPHENRDGERYLKEACRRGWEGLIAKRADAPYQGGRSKDWLKLKCSASQELVIGGFTEPAGSRTGFGALLVGHYERGALHYAGKVGTGFDAATLAELCREVRRLWESQPTQVFRSRIANIHLS